MDFVCLFSDASIIEDVYKILSLLPLLVCVKHRLLQSLLPLGGRCVELQTCAVCSHTCAHVNGDGSVRHAAVFAKMFKCQKKILKMYIKKSSFSITATKDPE